ncbi:MAG: N-acetyltransferase family protein [Acidimicrobiia bacterium]
MNAATTVRPARPDDSLAIARVIGHWGGGVVREGVLTDPSTCAQLVAERSGALVGVLSYQVERGACEVVALDADPAGQGTARGLLDAVVEIAGRAGCTRLWLVTTNDNGRAQRIYQQYGFDLAGVELGAVDRARATVKPSIPEIGEHGIPIRHELRYELTIPR